MSKRLIALCVALAAPFVASADRSSAPEGAYAYLISPADGETVPSTFTVRFGLSPNMGVAPAGVEREHSGHHHLLINVDEMPPMDRPLPNDENHRHFGKGQTEAQITLPPGKHRLRALLGNHHHIPHKPAVKSPEITITVLPPEKTEDDDKKSESGLPTLFR